MIKNELMKKVEPTKVKLADGKEYKLGPVNLNVLYGFEEEFNCGLDELNKKLAKPRATHLRILLYVLLKENHPDITKEQAGSLVSMDIIPQVTAAINEVIMASKTILGV